MEEPRPVHAAKRTAPKWYAWVIFAIAFLMVFVALGFGSSTKGTFLTAVTGSLGLMRSRFTIAESCRYISTGILSVFLGRTVEKIGLRKMAGFGFLFLFLAFVSNGFAVEIADGMRSVFPNASEGFKDTLSYIPFYIGGLLLGAGLAWTTNSMVGYLVENWFSNGKGTIMGFTLSANGLGAVASEFIVTHVIYGAGGSLSYAESHWKEAYLLIAALFLIVGVLAVLVIREHPEDVGLKPLWQDKKRKKERGTDWEGMDLKSVFRSPVFYIAGICVFLTGVALQTMVNVSKPHMYDLGYDKEYGIFVFAVHAIFLMIAKTLAGIGHDTIGMRKTYFVCSVSGAVAILSLYFMKPGGLDAGGANLVLPWVYSIVSCFGLPLETVMVILLTSYLFGKKPFKKVLGYFVALNTFGFALGVPIANLIYDTQGTYAPILPFLAGAMVLTLIVMEILMARTDRLQNKEKMKTADLKEESIEKE